MKYLDDICGGKLVFLNNEDNVYMVGEFVENDGVFYSNGTYSYNYYDYYKTERGYHARSGNSNDGWRVIGTQAYANSRFLYYINEIRSAVLVMHGEKAHSRYFGEAAYHYMVDGKAEGYKFVGEPNPNLENKQLLIIPGASHCDLYDGGYTELVGKGEPKNMIPWDKLEEFFKTYLR